MYKLELDDPRVAVPVAIYQQSEAIPDRFAVRTATKPEEAMAAPESDAHCLFRASTGREWTQSPSLIREGRRHLLSCG